MRIETITVNELRDGDVAFGLSVGSKLNRETEADLVAAQLGACGIAHRGQIIAVTRRAREACASPPIT